jgi:hypothetical protein
MYNVQYRKKEASMFDNYPPGAFSDICRMEALANEDDTLLSKFTLISKDYYLSLAKEDRADLKGRKVCYYVIDELNEKQDAIRSCIRESLKLIADGKSIHDFNSFDLLVYKCFMTFIERDAELIVNSDFTEL